MRITKALCALALVLAALTLGEAKNLYPTCGGIEQQAVVLANASGVVFRFPNPLAGVSLDCLAYEVESVKGGQKEDTDYCQIAHQTDYAYRLVLRAVYTDDDGVMITRDYDIRDIIGGSIAQLKVRLPQEATLSIILVNHAADSRCTLRARAILTWSAITGPSVQELRAPVLVAADPPTIYAGSRTRSHVVLRHPSVQDAKDTAMDIVFLTDAASTCASKERKFMELRPGLPENVVVSDPASGLYSSRAYTFSADDPGTYRLCYLLAKESAAVEVGIVNVFGGNPAYYEIVSGQTEDGRVLLGVPTTIKFYGHYLDTRPDGDRAKFVADGDSCEAGKPAGGVPVATDLGPADDHGPNTTYTLWTWTLKHGGSFKVCYKRSQAGLWTEVPSISVVGPGATTETPDAEAYPIPTDPISRKECPTAPKSTQEEPWVQYKSVKVELALRSLPNDLFSTFESVFCIPRSAFTLTHVTSTEAGDKVVYLSIFCEEVAGTNAPACSSLERYNYIAFLGSRKDNRLQSHGITSVECSTNMFAFGEDTVGREGVFVGALMISFSLVSSAALFAYAMVKYKERREYFVQFGVDDADIDDMYAFATVPAPFDNHTGPAPIRDAVIEMED